MLTVADPGETHIKEIYNGRKSTYSIWGKKNNNGFIQITFLQILSITDGVCFMNNNNNNSLQQSNNIFYTKPWYTNSSINSEKKKNSIG